MSNRCSRRRAWIDDWARNWIKEVKIDRTDGSVLKINDFAAGLDLRRPLDIKIGPDGAMYMIEFGAALQAGNIDSQVVRVEYLNNPSWYPEVTQVYVRGSTWTSAFKTYMEGQGFGDDVFGYRVDHAMSTDLIHGPTWTNSSCD